MNKVDEFSLINSIKQQYYRQSSLIKGIGDDGAVIRQTSQDIVMAVDTFVEDVHFSRNTMPPHSIGYRCMAANISDLAAMSATPAFYLVSIVIPPSWSEKEILEIYSGMKEHAETYQLDLIGGDTVAGKELSITVTIVGYNHSGKCTFRSRAREGDIVFVTGTLGDSQAGLHILMNDGDYVNKDYFIQRHQRPSPRVNVAQELGKCSRVTLNDISDGIANEAAEIAEASQVNLVLYADCIPVNAAFDQFSKKLQKQWKYFGGEDFELLGTIPEKDWHIVEEIAQKVNVKITNIGYVEKPTNRQGQVYLQKGNQKSLLQKDGYIHFK